jgi:HEAT repeat protein
MTRGVMVRWRNASMMACTRLASIALATTLVFAAAPALADPPARAEIVTALSGFERGPDLGTVRNWGTGAVRVLVDIANDAHVAGPARVRAVYALRAFPTDATARAFLRTTALDPSLLLVVRRAAFDALADGFGDVETLTRLLHDAAADVRDGAAWALSRVHTPTARAALRDALRTETNATVLVTLRRAVQ